MSRHTQTFTRWSLSPCNFCQHKHIVHSRPSRRSCTKQLTRLTSLSTVSSCAHTEITTQEIATNSAILTNTCSLITFIHVCERKQRLTPSMVTDQEYHLFDKNHPSTHCNTDIEMCSHHQSSCHSQCKNQDHKQFPLYHDLNVMFNSDVSNILDTDLNCKFVLSSRPDNHI